MSTSAIMDTIKRARRRTWPEALKREIVAAASAPGASVSVVARQYDVNPIWFSPGASSTAAGPLAPPVPQLVPVVVTADRPIAAPPAPALDMIEIELPRGARVRVGRGVRAATLRLVLDALERMRCSVALAGRSFRRDFPVPSAMASVRRSAPVASR